MIYSELYQLLNENGVRGTEHLHKLQRKQGRQGAKSYGLRKEVFEALEDVYKNLSSAPMPIRGVSLCLDASKQNSIPDMLVRKCLLFGETSTLLVKGAWKVQGPRKSGASFSDEYDYVVPKNLIEFILKHKNIVEDGLVVPIPNEIKTLERSRIPTQLSAVKDALPVSLKHQGVLAQLTEDELLKKPSRSGYANLLLPSLDNWSVEEVRNLRYELNDSFLAFHRQLRNQLKSSSELTTEDKLIELMLQTDDEIRKLHSEIKTVKKEARNRGIKTAVDLASAVLVALIPQPLATIVGNIFGKSTISKSVDSAFSVGKKFSELRKNDFYFAWKIGFGKNEAQQTI
ncbi:MAG: hypothetical protein AAF616_13260 [Bacteroidota bacterium]